MSTNNAGQASPPQPQQLGEAQQQSTQASPGTPFDLFPPQSMEEQDQLNLTPQSIANNSMFDKPELHFNFTAWDFNQAQYDVAQAAVMVHQSSQTSNESSLSTEGGDFLNLQQTGPSTCYPPPSSFSSFIDLGQQQWPATGFNLDCPRSSNGRRISAGIADRVSQFENLGGQGRPSTPPTQSTQNDYSMCEAQGGLEDLVGTNRILGQLLTPMDTPCDRASRGTKRKLSLIEGLDISHELVADACAPQKRQRQPLLAPNARITQAQSPCRLHVQAQMSPFHWQRDQQQHQKNHPHQQLQQFNFNFQQFQDAPGDEKIRELEGMLLASSPHGYASPYAYLPRRILPETMESPSGPALMPINVQSHAQGEAFEQQLLNDWLAGQCHNLNPKTPEGKIPQPHTPPSGSILEEYHGLSAISPKPLPGAASACQSRPCSSRESFSHSRSQSQASLLGTGAIADLNIEDTRTETGITMDDISQYITGPNKERRWSCTFEECGREFGRKENIKSHVQTHLGDRQYQCPVCRKCFVRQHDLKRHAKTHSGDKPYLCRCGNDFARQDALTRHRQRGMCIGGIDGVVKVAKKRGRPRKNPEAVGEPERPRARKRQRTDQTDPVLSPPQSPMKQATQSCSNARENELLALVDQEDLDDLTSGGSSQPQGSTPNKTDRIMEQTFRHATGASMSSAPMPGASSRRAIRSPVAAVTVSPEVFFSPEPHVEDLHSDHGSPIGSEADPLNTPLPSLSESLSPAEQEQFFESETEPFLCEGTVAAAAAGDGFSSHFNDLHQDMLHYLTEENILVPVDDRDASLLSFGNLEDELNRCPFDTKKEESNGENSSRLTSSMSTMVMAGNTNNH